MIGTKSLAAVCEHVLDGAQIVRPKRSIYGLMWLWTCGQQLRYMSRTMEFLRDGTLMDSALSLRRSYVRAEP